MSKRGTSYADSRYHVEGWRANIPLFRAIATSASIIISVMFLTWQGSQWVSDMRSEMREIRVTLTTLAKAMDDKATSRDVEHRFALMCAKAPPSAKQWACTQ
jgi:hypothetical protein